MKPQCSVPLGGFCFGRLFKSRGGVLSVLKDTSGRALTMEDVLFVEGVLVLT